MNRFSSARKIFSPTEDAMRFGWASSVFRAHDIILERLSLNPRAGDRISEGQLFNAFRQCLDEGIGHKGYKAGLESLVSEGYLEKTEDHSYRLTILGESYHFLWAATRRRGPTAR